MCLQAQRELFRVRLLWMLKGCPQVNKPTSVLLCTSSIAAGAHSRFTVQPPKLTTVNYPGDPPRTAHHWQLKPKSLS